MIKMICPCHFGLESVLSGEIRRIEGQNVVVTDGRVSFEGDHTMLARANMWLRTAERVLIEVGTFKAESFDELFEGVKALDLENYIAKSDAFPVKGHSINSKLHSIPDCQSIIKKAIVTRLKSKYKLDWFEETGAVHQVQFSLLKDVVTIMIDTSGEGLHKRGYRQNSNIAPIKETLAAGIIDLAHVKPHSILYDPFCGSGTFSIESATKAMNIAPGLNRRFSAQEWSQIPENIWEQEKQRALDLVRHRAEFKSYASDIDIQAIKLTEQNAKKAGVISKINLTSANIKNFRIYSDSGIVICNPPYGERMLEIEQAKEIYEMMGRMFERQNGFSYYIITPYERFESIFGRKADKKRKLYNGMIKCYLYMYYL